MVLTVKNILANKPNSQSAFNPKYRIQWLAVLSSHIITFVHGIAIGWLSPILIDLQTPEKTPLNFVLNVEQTSWIGACWGFGAFVGTLTCGFISAKIGRKKCMIIVAIPILISWILIYFAQNIWYLYAARSLAGWCGGSIFQIMPLYASEIADSCVRGAMSALIVAIWSGGILTGYIMSSHLDYFIIPCIASCFPIIFMIIMSLFPETPHYFLQKGRLKEAERSFRFYKRITDNNDPALQDFKKHFSSNDEVTKISWRDYTTKKSLKCFMVAILISGCTQLMGGFSLTQYMSLILQESGTQLDINMCIIILGVVQIIGSLFSVTFVDKIGRRCLMLTSMAGMSIGWFAFGIYLQYTTEQLRIELSWPPLALIIFIQAMGTIGMISLFAVIVVEAFPAKIRSKGCMITFTAANCIMIIQLKVYLLEIVYLGLANTNYLAGVIGAISFVYTYFNLEETTNKEINYD